MDPSVPTPRSSHLPGSLLAVPDSRYLKVYALVAAPSPGLQVSSCPRDSCRKKTLGIGSFRTQEGPSEFGGEMPAALLSSPLLGAACGSPETGPTEPGPSCGLIPGIPSCRAAGQQPGGFSVGPRVAGQGSRASGKPKAARGFAGP